MISQELKNKAKQIGREYNVQVNFRVKRFSGLAYEDTSTVSINTNRTEDKFFSALFHEIGHIHCFRNGIFPAYHYTGMLTLEIAKEFKKTAFKAECWVDKWAKKEMEKKLPLSVYEISYDLKTKKGKEFLDKYYQAWYKKIEKYELERPLP